MGKEKIIKNKEEIVGLITRVGYKKTRAKIITYFIFNEEGTSSQIEKEMNMSQPQVSESAREIIKKELLEVVSDKDGKGRPKNVYRRPYGIRADTIISSLEIELLIQKDNIKRRMSALRKIAKDI